MASTARPGPEPTSQSFTLIGGRAKSSAGMIGSPVGGGRVAHEVTVAPAAAAVIGPRSELVRYPPGCTRPWSKGEHDGGGPVPHAELGEDVADVGLDRALADVELVADLGVGRPRADQLEDAPLPFGELGERGLERRPRYEPVRAVSG